MDTLRLVLLVLGAILIGGMVIYYRMTSDSVMKRPNFQNLFSRLGFARQKTSSSVTDNTQDELLSNMDEPSSDDIAELSRLTPAPLDLQVDTAGLAPMSATGLDELEAADAEPMVIVLNIMARQGEFFHGEAILEALREQGWRFGAMNIFHFHVPGSQSDKPLCSLANTVEPGTLEPDNLSGMKTPGLSLFMQLPGPLEGREAFDRVIPLARGLAETLGGELCDDTRSVLTMQTIGHIKEQIEAYRFKQKMAAIKNKNHRR